MLNTQLTKYNYYNKQYLFRWLILPYPHNIFIYFYIVGKSLMLIITFQLPLFLGRYWILWPQGDMKSLGPSSMQSSNPLTWIMQINKVGFHDHMHLRHIVIKRIMEENKLFHITRKTHFILGMKSSRFSSNNNVYKSKCNFDQNYAPLLLIFQISYWQNFKITRNMAFRKVLNIIIF